MSTEPRADEKQPPHGSVLIVDDDAMTRTIYSKCLKNAGFDVEAVPSAAAALTMLTTRPFHLVLLDNIMPEMTGIELLEVLPSHQLASKPQIYMLSATDVSLIIDRCKALGAYGVLSKPIQPQALRDLAHRAVRPLAEHTPQ